MELEDQLKALLDGCTWVRDVDTALRVVPALGVDLPALTQLTDRSGRCCVPVACAAPIADAVTAVLREVLPEALDGQREPIHEADREKLLADPLVPVLASLMIETLSADGLSSRAVPALTVAWAAASAMGGGSSDPVLAEAVARLVATPPAERAEVMRRVSWSLSGRLAAASAMLVQLGYPSRAGGLARALLTTPLALCMPAGTLAAEGGLAVAAQLTGADVSPTTIIHLRAAVDAALAASAARKPQRPVDIERAALQREAGEQGMLAFGVGPRLVALLPELIKPDALIAAGVPREIATGLCEPRSAAALASTWADVLALVLRWDVLSAVIASVQPLRRIRGQWRVDAGALPEDVPWSLLTPRGPTQGHHSVVAVRLSKLRARARQAGSLSLAQGLADRVWASTAREHGGSAVTTAADHGIAIFPSAAAALVFANTVLIALRGLKALPMSGLGDDLPLPKDIALGVGIATGHIDGGTDGQRLSVSGPAVADAIGLAGIGPHSSDQIQTLRAAGAGPGGFHNSSIVVDAVTLKQLLRSAREGNAPLHIRGEGGSAGGVGQDFPTLPFRAWWKSQSTLIAALSLTEDDGAAEMFFLSPQDFQDLHREDSRLASRAAARTAPAAAAAAAAAGPSIAENIDPFLSQPAPKPPAHHEADPFADTPGDPGLDEETFGFDFGATGPDPFETSSEPEVAAFRVADRSTEDEDLSFAMPSDEPNEPAPPSISLEDEDEDEEGFSFAMPPDEPEEPAPPMFNFEEEDGEEEDFSFAMPPDEPDEPAPPMFSFEEEEDEDLSFAMPPDEPDESDLGFAMPSDEPAPPMFSFEEEEDEEGLSFAMPSDEPDEPAPPMIGFEDEEEDFGFAVPSDDPAPPMLTLEDEDEGGQDRVGGELGFEVSRDETAPPMLLDYDELDDDLALPGDDPAPPMLTLEDEELSFAMPSEEPVAVLSIEDEDEEEDEEEELSFLMSGGELEADMPTLQVQRPPLAPPMMLDDDPSGIYSLEEPVGAPAREEPELHVDDDDDDDESVSGVSEEFLSTDIAGIFQRYVVVVGRGMHTFGLLDEETIRDAHSYPSSKEASNVYTQFLMDKMREGFVPQVHRTQALEGQAVPLDMVHLESAYLQMMGR